MNKLSWSLYFADVSQSLSVFLGIISCSIFIITTIATLIYFAEEHEFSINTVWGGLFAFFLAIVCCLLPSKETVYMIAGSEATQMVVNTDTGKKIVEAINKTIDSYVNKERK